MHMLGCNNAHVSAHHLLAGGYHGMEDGPWQPSGMVGVLDWL